MIKGPIRVKIERIINSLIYNREVIDINYFGEYDIMIPKNKRKVKDINEIIIKEGLHPILKKVFELDPTMFIELCENIDMEDLLDYNDQVKW